MLRGIRQFSAARLGCAIGSLWSKYWIGVSSIILLCAIVAEFTWCWTLLFSTLIVAVKAEYDYLTPESEKTQPREFSVKRNWRVKRTRLASYGNKRVTWHYAKIRFEHQPAPWNPVREQAEIVAQVYGKCETEAMRTIRALYPSSDRIRILHFERQHAA